MEDLNWLNETAEKIRDKEFEVAKRNRHKIPYTAENGIFDDRTEDIGWWTNGFYAGLQWQLYNATHELTFMENAMEIEKKLDAVLLDPQAMDHDSGFRWLLTSVACFHALRSKESRNRALTAANNLAGRFNPAGTGFIRAWNDEDMGQNVKPSENRAGWAIIDCMMNLPLLYWASEVTKDARFRHIAMAHASTAAEWFIREDGSVRHICEFDPATGEFLRERGGQGCGEGSSWTRGQAWALYGFTLSFFHTGESTYLEAAEKVAAYFISNIPENGLIPVDFRPEMAKEPEDGSLGSENESSRPESGRDAEDSSAAAIAASGLILLASLVGNDRGNLPVVNDALASGYREAALKMLKALTDMRANFDPAADELIENCSGSYWDKKHNFPLIYADYFYTEAIFRLTGRELLVW